MEEKDIIRMSRQGREKIRGEEKGLLRNRWLKEKLQVSLVSQKDFLRRITKKVLQRRHSWNSSPFKR